MGAVTERSPEALGLERMRTALRRPRRRRRRRAIVVLLLVLAVVAVAVAMVDRIVFSYAPVEFGTLYGTTDEHRTLQPPGDDPTAIFRFEPDEEFVVFFNITNTGDRAVRVTDLPEAVEIPYVHRTAVEIGDGTTENEVVAGGAPDHHVDLEPFTLRPDEFRNVRLSYRFSDCELPPVDSNADPYGFGGGHLWATQPVDYEVFGLSRSSTFELPFTVALEGTIGECDPG